MCEVFFWWVYILKKCFVFLNNFNNFERRTKMCIYDLITKQDLIIVFI
jgi:hypothetical protein